MFDVRYTCLLASTCRTRISKNRELELPSPWWCDNPFARVKPRSRWENDGYQAKNGGVVLLSMADATAAPIEGVEVEVEGESRSKLRYMMTRDI